MVRNIVISALLLAVFGLLGAALVALIHEGTKARIEANIEATTLAQLNEILPADRYDNDIIRDVLKASDELIGGNDLTIYRARLDGQPAAAVLTVIARGGYSGDIHLLVGITADGRITGVRVVSHRETPGLGDDIEVRRSDWILGFDDRSLGDPPEALWRVRSEGGVFDQFTGATITPRAVVRGVRNALTYFQQNRDMIFQPLPDIEQVEAHE